MRQISRAAQLYIWLITVAGLFAFGFSAEYLSAEKILILALGCACSALAGARSVSLLPGTKHGVASASSAAVSLSLGFIPTFLTLLMLGPFAGMVAGVFSVLIVMLLPQRSYYYQVMFSCAAVVVSVYAAGLLLKAFGLTHGSWDAFSTQSSKEILDIAVQFCGIALAAIIYYLTNSFIIAFIVALTQHKKLFAVWGNDFLWTGLGYLVGASFSALVLALKSYAIANPLSTFLLALFALPAPALIFVSSKYHTQRDDARQKHIESLRISNQELETANIQLEELFTSTVESLALAIAAKDRYTKEHIQRVKVIAVNIAAQMGLVGDELKAIETGALLHDIGKIAIPEQILNKPDRLTNEEFDKIKQHPDMGARILAPVPFPFPVIEAVRHHHEKWDGTGYPDGLKGTNIPLGGRILAVADVYDILTSDRAYRKGWSHEEAITHLQAQAGKQFDPTVVDAFVAVLKRAAERVQGTDMVGALTIYHNYPDLNDGITNDINRASFEYLSMYAVSQAVATTVNLTETLTALSEKIREIFKAVTCVILLEDEDDTNRFNVRTVSGQYAEAFSNAFIVRGNGGITDKAASNQAFAGEFSYDLTRPEQIKLPTLPFKSVMASPLLVDGSVVGVVNLYDDRSGTYSVEDLRILQAVATQSGRAILNAIEYDRTLESALTDSLTGLGNERQLNRFLDQEMKLRATHLDEIMPLTVLLLDLDDFKAVNDLFGHVQGNTVLRELGKLFQGILSSGDLVVRYAGDAFVIVLPGTGADDANYVIHKIRTAIALYAPQTTEGNKQGGIKVGVSIGAASYPQDGRDSATLIAAADKAMYVDKKRPKNLLVDTHEVTRRFSVGVREVLLDHKLVGNPVAVWRGGKVIILTPEEIKFDEPNQTLERELVH